MPVTMTNDFPTCRCKQWHDLAYALSVSETEPASAQPIRHHGTEHLLEFIASAGSAGIF